MANEDLWRALETVDGDEDIAVSSSVKTLTLPTRFSGDEANGRAVIQCRTGDVLFTLNGTAPTAATLGTGTVLFVNGTLIVYGSEMQKLNLIRATGTDGAVQVRYERRIA